MDLSHNTPVNIQRYIKLITEHPLDKDVISGWYNCVKKLLPSGLIAGIQATDNNGTLKSSILVHREIKKENHYIISLTRDIQDKEAEPVVTSFMHKYPDIDFEIEISSNQADILSNNKISIPDNKFLDLCTSWAKDQHDEWMKDRLKNGWRYGPSISLTNKTHPLLRNWYEIPDKFRKINTTQPQKLIDLLNSNGYTVIGKDELESLLRLLKGL